MDINFKEILSYLSPLLWALGYHLINTLFEKLKKRQTSLPTETQRTSTTPPPPWEQDDRRITYGDGGSSDEFDETTIWEDSRNDDDDDNNAVATESVAELPVEATPVAVLPMPETAIRTISLREAVAELHKKSDARLVPDHPTFMRDSIILHEVLRPRPHRRFASSFPHRRG